jgi:hypothetical protein
MATIRQNALCIELAKCLYYLSGAYHGKAARDFDTLNWYDRQKWVEEAEAACESASPLLTEARADYFDLASTLARRQAAKVLARITPETPWGDPVLDPRD